jgi:subtilisin family serine protease
VRYSDNSTITWPVSGPYPNYPQDGYDTLFGQQSVSKNALVVGAVYDVPRGTPSLLTTCTFSGWGPTDDGRIKPDLVANGWDLSMYSTDPADPEGWQYESGTSYAAPIVTGTIGLLGQLYQKTYSHLPNSDMVRALLIHTADDWGPLGPDFRFGWGCSTAWRRRTL